MIVLINFVKKMVLRVNLGNVWHEVVWYSKGIFSYVTRLMGSSRVEIPDHRSHQDLFVVIFCHDYQSHYHFNHTDCHLHLNSMLDLEEATKSILAIISIINNIIIFTTSAV